MRWTHSACDARPDPRRSAIRGRKASRRTSRTLTSASRVPSPALDDESEIREVSALFFDMVDHAERCIYIENQYFTSKRFAEHLAKRMGTARA